MKKVISALTITLFLISCKGQTEKFNNDTKAIYNDYFVTKCSTFLIKNLTKKYNFNRMYSENNSCNPVKIQDIGKWNEQRIINKRAIYGEFSENYTLEFKDSKGKIISEITTTVSITFNGGNTKMKK